MAVAGCICLERSKGCTELSAVFQVQILQWLPKPKMAEDAPASTFSLNERILLLRQSLMKSFSYGLVELDRVPSTSQ